MKKKSQAVMEGTIALAAASLLLGLAFYIWGWGNQNIVARQPTYEGTRMIAGQSARSVSASGAGSGSKFIVWPTYFRSALP